MVNLIRMHDSIRRVQSVMEISESEYEAVKVRGNR